MSDKIDRTKNNDSINQHKQGKREREERELNLFARNEVFSFLSDASEIIDIILITMFRSMFNSLTISYLNSLGDRIVRRRERREGGREREEGDSIILKLTDWCWGTDYQTRPLTECRTSWIIKRISILPQRNGNVQRLVAQITNYFFSPGGL